jgi:hypothetical protein
MYAIKLQEYGISGCGVKQLELSLKVTFDIRHECRVKKQRTWKIAMFSETLVTVVITSCTLILIESAALQFQLPSRSGIALRLAFSMTRSAIGFQVTFVSYGMVERL